jgi:hypothetical protein
LMAAVHAVEVADGEGARRPCPVVGKSAKYLHGLGTGEYTVTGDKMLPNQRLYGEMRGQMRPQMALSRGPGFTRHVRGPESEKAPPAVQATLWRSGK